MSAEACKAFADAVIQHFPPYQWDEAQTRSWVASMVRELGGFPAEALERARDQMIRTRKDRRMPLVAECVWACIDAKKWIDAEKRRGQLPIERVHGSGFEWTAERMRLAYDLIRSPMGKEAAKSNWVLALWNFIRLQQRLPQPAEVKELCKEADEFDEQYAKCVRGGWGQAAALVKLGDGMLERRKKLAALALS